MFGVLYGAPDSVPSALEEVARDFSPRIEPYGPREIGIDLHGVSRLFGDAREVADELRRTAADRGLRVRVAIAGTRTAARLLVRHRAGLTIVESGTEAAAVAPLPLALLDALTPADGADTSMTPHAPGSATRTSARNYRIVPTVPPQTAASSDRVAAPGTGTRPSTASHQPPTAILRQWGLRTLGEFAALASDEVAARLGQAGVWWQRIAAGEDPAPLVPAVPEERFEEALDLEWPIDGLEPLSFVLGRLMEPLAAHLERRDRGAAVLHVRLHLVTRTVHERSLQLPVAMRDPRTLRTLALLDLESNPPSAAIDRVVVAVDPTPGRIVQYSLLTRPLPSPEQLSTLMARLTALMGEGRCGAPALVDSWQPGAFAVAPFAPQEASDRHPVEVDDARPEVVVALRRFRFPIPARVRVEEGKPVRVMTDRRGLSGGRVETCAGPWRTSGAWWMDGGGRWDCDEWDVTLADGATYRLSRHRDVDQWFLDGVVD
jgi:protein ImuB